MSKIIWIDNLCLFKIKKIYSTQYLCICSQEYKNNLDMKVGDIIFMKEKINSKSYKRLGEIKAFSNNKVIVSIMPYIGTGIKSRMEILHKGVLEEEDVDVDVENN